MQTALSSNMSAITSSCAQNRPATTSTITASTKRWKTFPPSARPCRPSTTTISTCSRTSWRPLLIAANCENLLNQQSPLPESASPASSSITLGSLPSCTRWCASRTSPPATPSLRPKSTPPSSKRSAAPPSTTRSLRSATTSRNSAPRVLLPSSPTLAVINCIPQGYSICLVFLKLFERIYAPLTAGLLSPIKADARLQTQRRSQLDRLYQRVVDDLDTLVRTVGLKAA